MSNGNDLRPFVTAVPTDDFRLFRGSTQDAEGRATAAAVAAMLSPLLTAGSAAAPASGLSTLVAGTASAISALTTTSSNISLSRQEAGGTLGHLSITDKAAGSFGILSSSNTETSSVFWEVKNSS